MFFYRENIVIQNNPYSLNLNLNNFVFSNTLINGEATGSVTISATGTGTESVTITDDSGQFTVSPASFNLNGGSSQNVTLVFSPTSAGNKTATINILAYGGSTAQLTLSGSGSQFVETQTLFGTGVANPLDIWTNAYSNIISENGQKLFVGAQSGHVHIYNNLSGTFQLEQVLKVFDYIYPNGLACSYDGNILAIGDPNINEIKIYKNISGSWSLAQTLSNPSVVNFGLSVAMSSNGNTLLTMDLLNEGKAYVYQYNGSSWIQETTIALSDYLGRLVYGTGNPLRINSSGDRLFLGCDNEQGTSEIHIFNKISGSWNYSTGLTQTPAVWNSQFPTSQNKINNASYCTAINSSGSKMAIRFTAEGTFPYAGENYDLYKVGIGVYNSSSFGWNLEQIVTGNVISNFTPEWGRDFSFNSSGDSLVIGGLYMNIEGQCAQDVLGPSYEEAPGVVYVHISGSTGWKLSQILTGSGQNNYYGFGANVDIDSASESISVGVPMMSNGDYVGAAYVFKKQ